MADTDIVDPLERKFLIKNLLKEEESDEDGGKKTRIEIDSDHSYHDDNDEYYKDDQIYNASSKSKSGHNKHYDDDCCDDDDDGGVKWADILSKNRMKGNTGPKGVKADYEEATAIQKRMNETKMIKQIEEFKRETQGISSINESVSASYQLNKSKNGIVNGYDADKDEDQDEDEDDAFYEEFRKKRLQQLKLAASS